MIRQAIASKEAGQSGGRKSHGRHYYQKVLDGRKQAIRGLWTRNGFYIARVRVALNEGGTVAKWVTLTDDDGRKLTNLGDARSALEKLRTQRHDDDLPVLGRVPTLAEYVPDYLRHRETLTSQDALRPATLLKDRWTLAAWVKVYGSLRLNQLKAAHIIRFRDEMLRNGSNPRTANLAVITLRGLCKHAKLEGHLKSLPMQDLRQLKGTVQKRRLVSAADLANLAAVAMEPRFVKGRLARVGEAGQPLKNAVQFGDYLLLLAYAGTRRSETLRLRWQDVDFEGAQITIGADGLAKNHESRVVDFNPKLEEHLRAMRARRAPDSDWLFPSPQRGERDIHALTFMESLRLARLAAGMPGFGFHDCRHFFISYCVMSGIDFMTIARWVGHKDGGFLIGKVYGHLSNEHAKAQAQRVNFGPTIAVAAQIA
ncbi:MAG: tyrosine-type recombinase/integrase [Limisphaerales bacterium]